MDSPFYMQELGTFGSGLDQKNLPQTRFKPSQARTKHLKPKKCPARNCVRLQIIGKALLLRCVSWRPQQFVVMNYLGRGRKTFLPPFSPFGRLIQQATACFKSWGPPAHFLRSNLSKTGGANAGMRRIVCARSARTTRGEGRRVLQIEKWHVLLSDALNLLKDGCLLPQKEPIRPGHACLSGPNRPAVWGQKWGLNCCVFIVLLNSLGANNFCIWS